jgi:MFS family permease
VLVGLIFLFAFSAYQMEQNYAGKLYGELLGSEINLALYATFTFACFVAPMIVLSFGIKESMALGLLGYATLTVAGLIYFNTGKSIGLLIAGAMCVGFGASLLWTAQGTFLLQHSDDSNRGFLFSVFWAIFNGNGVLGGFLSFMVFNKTGNGGSTTLYATFLICILFAAVLCLALKLPRQTTAANHSSLSSSGDSAHSVSGSGSTALGGGSAFEEFAATLRMFRSPMMLKLALFFAYTYSFAAYQLQVFARFFDKTAFGVANIVYYTTEILMAIWVGQYLDSGERRPRAIAVLSGTTLLVLVAYAMALSLEMPLQHHPWTEKEGQPEYTLSDPKVVAPFVTFALWGLSDCTVQTYAFWLIGAHFDDPREQARVMGFYKMMQSGTTCLGYAIAPHVGAVTQILILVAIYLLGVFCSLFALPSDAEEESSSGGREEGRRGSREDASSPIVAKHGGVRGGYGGAEARDTQSL